MIKSLNMQALADALPRAGLNAAGLAGRLGVNAIRMRTALLALPNVGSRVNAVRDEAAKHLISPYTIRMAIAACEVPGAWNRWIWARKGRSWAP